MANPTQLDIHREESHLNNLLKSIELGYNKNGPIKILDKNKQTIKEFYNFLIAQGISQGRVRQYIQKLKKYAEFIDKKEFDKTDRKTVEEFLANYVNTLKNIQTGDPISPHTVSWYKITLRKFYCWFRKTGENEVASEVNWFKTSIPANKKRTISNGELITEKEWIAILKEIKNPMYAALFSCLREGSLRIGEAMSIQLQDLRSEKIGDRNVIYMTVRGKTGEREIAFVEAVPYLTEWLDKHPKKQDNASFVFISSDPRCDYKTPGGNSIRYQLKKAGKAAKIDKKKIWPYLIRHTSLTEKGLFMNDTQLKVHAGWSMNSDQQKNYLHPSKQVGNTAYLKHLGLDIESDEPKKKEIANKTCHVCGIDNKPFSSRCYKCGNFLNVKEMIAAQAKQDELLEMFSEKELEQRLMDKLEKRLLSKLKPPVANTN